ncbi:hypothetical protein HMPREF2844_09075 [Neisseria sp. HMSC072F04]|nr:hypothetical protein HMPREF2844_09075 [Neisseria sp. HMSC072F04]
MAKYGGFKYGCFLIVLHATKNSSLSGFVGAFSQCFPFAVYTVFQAENFPAYWGNFKIQSTAVKQLGLFPCFGGLGVFDLSAIQRHGGGMF